jgi:hypothetical protein
LLRHPTLVAVLLLAASAADARASQGPLTSNSQAETRAVEAVRIEHPPKLDGTLDDPLWESAHPITDFHQREPYEGQAPTEKTEVRILYTHCHLLQADAASLSSSSAVSPSTASLDIC